jgi:hypothetical protein
VVAAHPVQRVVMQVQQVMAVLVVYMVVVVQEHGLMVLKQQMVLAVQ